VKRFAGLVCACVAAAGAAASADVVQPTETGLYPNTAGKPSHLVLVVEREQLEAQDGRLPSAIEVQAVRGLKVDPRAVPGRCTDEQADAFACPRSSLIGGGQVEGRAEGPFIPGGFDFTAQLSVFLTDPRSAGDIAGVAAILTEPQTGQRYYVHGRIVPIPRGQFGVKLRLEGLDGFRPAPEVTVKLKRVFVDAARDRTVRRHGRRVRYSLLTNPRKCSGRWPYAVEVEYPDGRAGFGGTLPCRKR
jgi:hypothetical protein